MTLAVGFFDGVHLGHQAILRGADAALTFSPHPLSLVDPARAPRLLMSADARLSAIRACGVGRVVVLDFTPDLAALGPGDFLKRLEGLVGTDGPLAVRCGDNWRFGAGGKGDAAFLRAHGVGVTVVPFAAYRGERISSTRIRAALESGAVADANAMLGRPFSVSGTEFRGKGEGARLGFPTVNLRLSDLAVRLPFGVYAVEADGRRGVADYGLAPTMGDRAWTEPVMEVHFVDGPTGALPAKAPHRVSLVRFVRPERRFDSLDDLKRQIAEDVASCRD